MNKLILALVFISSIPSFNYYVRAAEKQATLAVGEEAPDFTLTSNSKEQVTLSQFKGKKNVVLYFYPKDNTPGCTTEAEGFSKLVDQFSALETVIFGINTDDQKSHDAFSRKLTLKFPLLVDTGGKVSKNYNAMGWIMSKRVTYVINKKGIIAKIYTEVDVSKHPKDVLTFIQGL